MKFYSYEFLKEEFIDLWELFYDTEQNLVVVSSPNTAIIKTRQIVETLSKKIVEKEGLRKFVEGLKLEEIIQFLESRNLLSSEFVALFHEIRQWGNKGIHDNKKNATVATDLFKKLFQPTCWFATTYGNGNYIEYVYTMENLQDKDIFQQYLLKKKEEAVTKFLSKDGLIQEFSNPFEMELIEEAEPIQINPFERYGFETEEEFTERLRVLPPITIGQAMLDLSYSRLQKEEVFVLFANTIQPHPSVSIPHFSVSYIEKHYIQDSLRSIKCPIEAKVKWHHGTLTVDLSTLTITVDGEKVPIQGIVLEQMSWETKEEYTK